MGEVGNGAGPNASKIGTTCTGRQYENLYGYVDARAGLVYSIHMTARKIIALFGGIRPMAKVLGHRSHTTVQWWWDNESLPLKRRPEIIAAARAKRFRLKKSDFPAI